MAKCFKYWGAPKFCEKGGDNLSKDFEEKDKVDIHICKSKNLFLRILKQGHLF